MVQISKTNPVDTSKKQETLASHIVYEDTLNCKVYRKADELSENQRMVRNCIFTAEGLDNLFEPSDLPMNLSGFGMPEFNSS